MLDEEMIKRKIQHPYGGKSLEANAIQDFCGIGNFPLRILCYVQKINHQIVYEITQKNVISNDQVYFQTQDIIMSLPKFHNINI